MASPTQTKPLQVTLQAAPALVYRAWTNSTALREWLCDVATTAPRVGGHFFLAWHYGFTASGTFTHLVPGKKIVLDWRGGADPVSSELVIHLEPAGTGTRMTLVHRGLENFLDPVATAAHFEQEWRSSIPNLVSVLDEGPDLRITQRPMLGVLLGNFSQEIAEQLGVPVIEGIHVDGVVQGTGAEAAGLQKDDVIISVNRIPMPGIANLGEAISRRKAGDVLEVVYYRGAELRTTQMQLSARPVPEIPANPAELAEHLRRVYSEALASLDELLADVTDEQAARRPAPDGWSVRETLAHLIHAERSRQATIYQTICGEEAQFDSRLPNLPVRIQATLAAYPTLPNLMEELKRLSAETQAMLRHLPEEFLARKGSYWKLGYHTLNYSEHITEHLAQIKATLEK